MSAQGMMFKSLSSDILELKHENLGKLVKPAAILSHDVDL